MRTPKHSNAARAGFRMLSSEAQKTIPQYEHTVICLMVCVAATSIVWSVSMHILSGDFYHGIIGAKLAFQVRETDKMHPRARKLFNDDLEILVNETYTEAALESHKDGRLSKTATTTTTTTTTPMESILTADNQALTDTGESTTTKKPKVRKIAHLFQTSSNSHVPAIVEPDDDDNDDEANTTMALPKIKFNVELDRKYLSSMTIDIHETRWHQSAAVQFIYGFPFLSEIIAIIWTAMCLIYQSGVKKYWGLPKPWRIVVPSILIFSLMSVSTLVYTILANGFVKAFCKDLRGNLTDPNALSCGQAMSVLRPIIRKHEFSHDVYLNLFRISYILTLVFWLLALVIMLLRYVLAIDFQLVDVNYAFENRKIPEIISTSTSTKEPEFTEVLLNSPQRQQEQPLPKLLLLNVDECQKSEDDFESAKSHLSEAVTPLLDFTQPKLT